MLDREHACGKRLGGVALFDRHAVLHDDRAGVELRRHEMDRDTRDVDAVFERLALRIDAGECRQQRRMNVQDRLRKRLAEFTS